MTRQEMEKMWNQRGVLYGANRVIWTDYGYQAGEACVPNTGFAAWLNTLRPKDYNKWGTGNVSDKLPCPKWLRERYRKNCPRNAAVLIREYGGYNKNDKKCDDWHKRQRLNAETK